MGYQRSVDEKRKLKKLTKEAHNFSAAYYDERKQRLVRWYIRGPKSNRFLRRMCSKRVRKCKEVLNYNKYKRTYDYWWTVD